jgi:hypothetical protein
VNAAFSLSEILVCHRSRRSRILKIRIVFLRLDEKVSGELAYSVSQVPTTLVIGNTSVFVIAILAQIFSKYL